MAERKVSQKVAVGDRFGRWVVKAEASPQLVGKRQSVRWRWSCLCDCGCEKEVLEVSLAKGLSQSCGCYNREVSSIRHTAHGHARHGQRAPEFGIYHAMRSRCERPTDKRFKDYGKRGITVDPIWSTYKAFYESMGPRPTPQHQLDRINNDEGYSPENCRWVTPAENMVNRRNTKTVSVDGVDVPVATLAKTYRIPANTLRGRIEAGWGIQRALTSPIGPTSPTNGKRKAL